MFKKTLVASALALAAFGSQAAVVAITGTNVSLEGSVGAASIPVPNTVVTLAAEYTVNDEITFTVTGAEFDAASVPALAAAFAVDAADAASFGFLSQTANTVSFRITSQTDNGADGVLYTGGTFTLSGMVLTTSTVLDAAGDISVAYAARTGVSGTAIDSSGTLTDVSNTVVAQFSSTTTKLLNGIIDVENDRQQYTTGNDTITTDVLTVTPVEAGAAVNDAVYNGATIVVGGDFSFMETDGDAGIDAAELAAAFAATGADTYTSVINAAGDAITVSVADGGGNTVEIATMTFTVAGLGATSATLSVQDFTVETTLNYDTAAAVPATKATQTAASAGAWTLNGAQAFFSYLPVGYTGLQNSIVLTNNGVKDGGVVIEGFDEAGNTYGPMTMADELVGGTNMTITGPDVMSLLTVPAGTKVSLTITVNAPDNDVDFSGYTQKAGTGRQLMAVKYL